MTRPVQEVRDACLCGHGLVKHERSGHGWLCFALPEIGKKACPCETCVDERDSGDGPGKCACRRFRAVAAGAVDEAPSPGSAA